MLRVLPITWFARLRDLNKRKKRKVTSTYIAHVVAKETDPSKSTASLLFHQETTVDGTTETTNAAVWTYQNFVQAALYNSTLDLTEAKFSVKVVEGNLTAEVVLYDDSNASEEEPPVVTLKSV